MVNHGYPMENQNHSRMVSMFDWDFPWNHPATRLCKTPHRVLTSTSHITFAFKPPLSARIDSYNRQITLEALAYFPDDDRLLYGGQTLWDHDWAGIPSISYFGVHQCTGLLTHHICFGKRQRTRFQRSESYGPRSSLKSK